jgi:hypothetical protein
VDHFAGHPLLIWIFGGQRVLDLFIFNDSTGCGIHQKHLARLQSALADNGTRVYVKNPCFRSQYDESVVTDPEAARP